MTPTTHRIIAALNLPASVRLLIGIVRAVLLAMTGNAKFPSPTPALATVDAALSDLEKAQAAVDLRTKGATKTRNEKRAALVQLLDALKAYVQGIADADPANAAAIIGSAAMAVHKSRVHGPRPFAAKPSPTPGSVVVTAPSAGRRASYEWQWSPDGGKTWLSAPVTAAGRTTLTGLPVGTLVPIRYRATTKQGQGEWSLPLSFLVR
jgi:hypothetical protein